MPWKILQTAPAVERGCRVWHWEHGYRCHGLWIGTKRLARVSIGHRGLKHDGAHPYSWEIDVAPYTAGRAKNLKAAKRAAENALDTVLSPSVHRPSLETREAQLARFRDCVLNQRFQLEEGTLDNDQINAVLALFDDQFGPVNYTPNHHAVA